MLYEVITLATRDMGEGIGLAIQSGMRAADAILTGGEFSVKSISKYRITSYNVCYTKLLRWETGLELVVLLKKAYQFPQKGTLIYQ